MGHLRLFHHFGLPVHLDAIKLHNNIDIIQRKYQKVKKNIRTHVLRGKFKKIM